MILKKVGVEIDSQNIKDVTIQSLRRHIAMVSQDVVLFDDTVKANIAYGNIEASDKEILEAANSQIVTNLLRISKINMKLL